MMPSEAELDPLRPRTGPSVVPVARRSRNPWWATWTVRVLGLPTGGARVVKLIDMVLDHHR